VDEPVRLSKCVVALTGCSRNQAQQYIEGGWVLVDGEVIDEPQFPVQGQTVTMAPGAKLEPIEPATLLLHRDATPLPDDASLGTLLTAQSRSDTDATGIRALRRHFQRLTECLPLEPGATGLAVLTQDGRLLRRMQDEGERLEQEILVEVEGTLAPYDIKQLEHGLSYLGRVLPPAKVSWQSETKLRFAIKGVRPGQLASMCAAVGLQVVSIRRLRIGRVSLGKMAQGEWRYLPSSLRF
jgi:23S rRNA pseudouridine2604 synthase